MDYNFNKTVTGIYPYDRKKAYLYAAKWAFSRNPEYYDFENLGGDCTNFISQALHAGGCPMNHTRDTGWYFYNLNNRAAAWTGVEFLYRFLMNNKGRGPIARLCKIEELEVGDIIQLNFEDDNIFNHSLLVVRIEQPINHDNIFISTHTDDRFDYQLSNYYYNDIRYIHIEGYKY
ncbi:hypothetical protein CLPU_16c00600 [Gottschalkia purinilytica]|uniref:Putative amidase domain-containing protein n=1 Tax=Gottschalkia purinilytica TaxID=1503 RepID=A0A0L0W7L5_GOTPU|nr:amidase domain-containing protein [Gottschalkia purinilytica]KNF07504.1 hypothetical protein CLPU_16c00600 [Gottschalkia purinilytica]